jgi:hypothetical protein
MSGAAAVLSCCHVGSCTLRGFVVVQLSVLLRPASLRSPFSVQSELLSLHLPSSLVDRSSALQCSPLRPASLIRRAHGGSGDVLGAAASLTPVHPGASGVFAPCPPCAVALACFLEVSSSWSSTPVVSPSPSLVSSLSLRSLSCCGLCAWPPGVSGVSAGAVGSQVHGTWLLSGDCSSLSCPLLVVESSCSSA